MPDVPVPDAKATIVKVGEISPTPQKSRDWSDDLSNLFLLLQKVFGEMPVDTYYRLPRVIHEGATRASGSYPTSGAPAATTTNYVPVWTGPVDQRFELMQRSNIEYHECQRNKFTFT